MGDHVADRPVRVAVVAGHEALLRRERTDDSRSAYQSRRSASSRRDSGGWAGRGRGRSGVLMAGPRTPLRGAARRPPSRGPARVATDVPIAAAYEVPIQSHAGQAIDVASSRPRPRLRAESRHRAASGVSKWSEPGMCFASKAQRLSAMISRRPSPRSSFSLSSSRPMVRMGSGAQRWRTVSGLVHGLTPACAVGDGG